MVLNAVVHSVMGQFHGIFWNIFFSCKFHSQKWQILTFPVIIHIIYIPWHFIALMDVTKNVTFFVELPPHHISLRVSVSLYKEQDKRYHF